MTEIDLIRPARMDATRRDTAAVLNMLAVYEQRFAEIEPHIQAFLPEDGRFERLRREARALETRFPDRETHPPLYGVPVGIKDIFHADGFVTQAGTVVPPELFVAPETKIVTVLKQAGALVAGKTVTCEFAYLEPGATRNPHHLAYTPGGSSSGSAAAVAAGLVPLAVGTQTVGSTIRPAAYCGIVGYKPSFDRIDTTGLMYFSRSVDHVGLFAQDVAGMRIAAAVTVNDWREEVLPSRPVLAVPDGAYLQQASALAAFENQVDRLKSAGYTVRRFELPFDINALAELHTDLIAAEFAREHSTWFPRYEHLYRPRTAGIIRRGQVVTEARLKSARENRFILREHLHQIMHEHDVDAWVCPAAPDHAPIRSDSTGSAAMNLMWTHAGLPCVTVPAGRDGEDLPLGLQICGASGSDERVLMWAETIAAVFQA